MNNLLNKLRVKGKINVITIFVVLSLGVLTTAVYNSLNTLEADYSNTNKILTLSQDIMKSVQQGLQVTSALRGVIVNPDDTKAKNNFLKAVNDFDNIISQLEKAKIFQMVMKNLMLKIYITIKKIF